MSRPGRRVQLGLELMDRQLVDRHGRLCGTVDDLELEVPEDGSPPYVTAVLSGPAALAARLEGRLGGWVARLHARAHPAEAPGPVRIPWVEVTSYDSHVVLARAREELETDASERWLADHLIGRIPGGTHAPG
jgi:hypothetical protein